MWGRRVKRAGRLEASSVDPLGEAVRAAVARGPLKPQYEGDELSAEELPEYFQVEETNDLDGFNTVVGFSDEICSYVDAYESGLEQIVSEHSGIEEVLAEDREVLYLRTRLSLQDVAAVVLSSIVEANLNPRPPAVDPAAVTEEQVLALLDAVAPLLTQRGFHRKEGTARARLYLYRTCADGFVQALSMHPGLGELTDGTQLGKRVMVMHGTYVPETAHPSARATADPANLAVGHCNLSRILNVEPTEAGLERLLHEDVLPWMDGTQSRGSLAAWASEDPSRIFPPAERPKYALVLAKWGYLDAAQSILDHLKKEWRSLSTHPAAVEAQVHIHSEQ